MIAALDCTGNPSSVHAEGRRARGIVNSTRESGGPGGCKAVRGGIYQPRRAKTNGGCASQPTDVPSYADIEHDSVLANVRHARAADRASRLA